MEDYYADYVDVIDQIVQKDVKMQNLRIKRRKNKRTKIKPEVLPKKLSQLFK